MRACETTHRVSHFLTTIMFRTEGPCSQGRLFLFCYRRYSVEIPSEGARTMTKTESRVEFPYLSLSRINFKHILSLRYAIDVEPYEYMSPFHSYGLSQSCT